MARRIPIVPLAIGVGALWLLLTTPASATTETAPPDRERRLEQQRLQAQAESVVAQVRANPQNVSVTDLRALASRVRGAGLEELARSLETQAASSEAGIRTRFESVLARLRANPTERGLLEEMVLLLPLLEGADLYAEEVELSAAIDDLRSASALRERGNQLLLAFGRNGATPNTAEEMRQIARELRFTGDSPTLAAGLEERARIIEERLKEMGPALQASFARGI